MKSMDKTTLRRHFLILLLPVLLFVFLISGSVLAASSDIYSVRITGTRYYDRAAEVLNLVNQERSSLGLDPLAMDRDLTEAAMKRAAECAVDFSHTRPDGSDCSTIVEGLHGENIAAGNRTAQATFDQWKNSSRHYANMINSSYKSIDIGCFQLRSSHYYWVQVFSRNTSSEEPSQSGRVVTETVKIKEGAYPLVYSLKKTDMDSASGAAIEVIGTGSYVFSIGRLNAGWDPYEVYTTFNNDSFTYESSNPEVARVEETGLLTGCSPGTAVITVMPKIYDNKPEGLTVKITVENQFENAVISEIKDMTYTGDELKPEPSVTLDGVTLRAGKDYAYSYESNINAGTGYVIINGIGQYSGTARAEFKINRRDIKEVTTEGPGAKPYCGEQITPDVSCTYAEKVLVKDTDYTVSYGENINAGENAGKITLTGIKNFSGTLELSFTITGKFIGECSIALVDDQVYNGAEICVPAVITDGQVQLKEKVDYTLSFIDNINVGTATGTVTGIGNYSGSAPFTFKIIPKELVERMIVSIDDAEYTGSAVTPKVVLSYSSHGTLAEGTDYDVKSEKIDVGEASATITGNGNFTGSLKISFNINPRDISKAAAAPISGQVYDGKEKTPEVVLTDNGVTLKPESDYTFIYDNNINAGDAVVLISGTGNYTGKMKVPFTIQPAPIEGAEVTCGMKDPIYNGNAHTAQVTVKLNGKDLVYKTDYTVSFENNIDVTDEGATAIVTGTGNYSGAVTKTGIFHVLPATIKDAEPGVIKDQVYSAQPQTPGLMVTLYGKTLALGTDYTLTYENNTNVTKEGATITITGTGNYTGVADKKGTFGILQRSITDGITISEIPDQEYTGSEICPSVTVMLGEITLTPDTGYDITYTDNKEPGTATAVITGKNNLKEYVKKTFTIKEKKDPVDPNPDNPASDTPNNNQNPDAGSGRGNGIGAGIGNTVDIYGNVLVTEEQKEQQILGLTNDNDPAGSTYSLLQAKMKNAKKTSVTITWKKVPCATSYVVFGNKCGKNNRYQKITTVTGTKYTQKNLKKGTYYKYLIVAVGQGKALATSKTIHVATSGGKVGNDKAVKLNKSKVTLKLSKKSKRTFKLIAKTVAKGTVKKHRKICYESSDPNVATVNKKGVIKAVAPGKCKVYAYAQDGMAKAITVTVKK